MIDSIAFLINRILRRLNLVIHRINAPARAQGMVVRDALTYNTEAVQDEFWASKNAVSEYLSKERLRFYESVLDLVEQKGITLNGKDIADMGCGTGHLLKAISERHGSASLTGFDYSESAVTLARATCPNAVFKKTDMYTGAGIRFDIVFSIEVLEHLLYPNRAMHNLLGMLNRTGTLIATVPDGRRDTFLGHINFWSPESWRVFIESACAGFWFETGIVDGANFAIIKAKQLQ